MEGGREQLAEQPVRARERARETAERSEAREAKEAATRAAFLDGQLGLDRYGLRDTLKRLGVEYRTYEEYTGHGS